MRYRSIIILVLLVAVPIAAAVVAARFLLPGDSPAPSQAVAKPAAPPPVEKPKTRKVFGAARDLPMGTLLTEEDMTPLDVPENEIRRGHVVVEGASAIETLRGYAVREGVGAGAALTWSAVVGPGQRGFLAAVLKPGTRAVTIQLGAGTRHAGLIDPGDRVDVILTAKLRLADNTQSVFTRRILEDARVVAVDRQLGSGAGTAEGGGDDVKRTSISTATLEVSPAQADRLALGEHEGRLSLAVRSLAATTGGAAGEVVDLEELLSLPTAKSQTGAPPVAATPTVDEPAPRGVLVAARALPVGTLLREEDLTERDIGTDTIPHGHVVVEGASAIETLRGYAVRERVDAGAALTWSSVVGPGQRGFLAAVLKPGTRAVTIQLGAGTRHAGLIDPGDRVDVILTAKLRLADNTLSVFTRRILEDARVVAVDRQLGSGAGTAEGGGDMVERTSISTATLEVSPPQADRLALGEHEGQLSLAVRSLAATTGEAAGEVVDLHQLLASPLSDGPGGPGDRSKPANTALGAAPNRAALTPPKTVRIIRGGKVHQLTFSDDPDRPRIEQDPPAEQGTETDDRRQAPDTQTSQ